MDYLRFLIRIFLYYFKKRLVILSTILFFTGILFSKEKERKPNIVLILADDLGWKDTSTYGSEFYETPNISRLAARGMMFTQAYAASPVCSPTRASILTGLYPARIGIIDRVCNFKEEILKVELQKNAPNNFRLIVPISATRLSHEYFTLAEALKEEGYVTGHFGKWHLGHEPYDPLHHGFDVDIPHTPEAHPLGGYIAPWKFPPELNFQGKPGEHIEDRMAEEAIKFIKENKDRPFFLNYWMFSVHSPWQSKPELVEKYAKKAKPDSLQRNPVYGAMVEVLDYNVGRIIDTLDELGISDNTIIIFFSDNGGVTGTFNKSGQAKYNPPTNEEIKKYGDIPITSNYPLKGGKGTLYEGGTRVPCIVVWPGKVKPGTKTDAIIQSTDFYPTILEMAGIKVKENLKLDGISFVPVLLGKKGQVRDTLFCYFYPHPKYQNPKGAGGVYIRKGDWKLIKFFYGNEDFSHRYELYNLKDDIEEKNNLAEKMPEKVKELEKILDNFLKDCNAIIPQPNPEYKKKTEK